MSHFHEKGSFRTSWKPPRWLLNMNDEWVDKFRRKYGILAEGENCPRPCPRFADMKLPKALLMGLKDKSIEKPTAIQMQVRFSLMNVE